MSSFAIGRKHGQNTWCLGLDGVVFLTKIRKKDKKLIFILVGKPEVKRLLEDPAINRRTVVRQILAVV